MAAPYAPREPGPPVATYPWQRGFRIFGLGLGLCVLLTGCAILATAIYTSVTTVPVIVLNTGPTELRLSGCVDDANDIASGRTTEVDVPTRSSVGCEISMAMHV